MNFGHAATLASPGVWIIVLLYQCATARQRPDSCENRGDAHPAHRRRPPAVPRRPAPGRGRRRGRAAGARGRFRSEEHTSELQSLMRISYAAFCLKKTKRTHTIHQMKDIDET